MEAPEIAEKSSQVYTTMLNSLKKHLNETSLDFLLDAERVCAWIDNSKYANNTRKMYYIAIVNKIRGQTDENTQKAIGVYRKKMEDYNNKQKEIYESQELNEKEKGKFLPWKDVLQVRKKLEEKATDLYSFQEYLIVSLYTMMPPVRLDYAKMKVVVGLPQDTSGNYMAILPHNKYRFILNQYKTAKTYGQAVYDAPPCLCKVIKQWLGMFLETPEWLLWSHEGEPMSESVLSNTVRTIFQREANKGTTITTLRQSFVSHQRKGELPLRSLKSMAKQMCQSVDMNCLYRRL